MAYGVWRMAYGVLRIAYGVRIEPDCCSLRVSMMRVIRSWNKFFCQISRNDKQMAEIRALWEFVSKVAQAASLSWT